MGQAMNKELQQRLFDRYPEIFKDRALPEQQSCMARGIECGDGWYHLLDQLCAWLQNLTDEEGCPQVVARQVKSKFGGLRFYYRLEGDQSEPCAAMIRGAISFASIFAESVCERCGAPGQRNETGWIFTLCDDCRRSP